VYVIVKNTNIIILSEDEKQKYTDVLVKYYAEKGLSEHDALSKIEEVFAECQMGWERAPKDISTRIKVKTGFQWISHENLKPRQKKDINIKPIEESPEEIGTDNYLFKFLSQSEQNWWNDRKVTYEKEFDFNNSSDQPLFTQLLFEELIQRRLFISQLKNPHESLDKQLNDSLKRVTELQIKLGITREQRAGVLDKIDGNIAEISVSLDDKLKKIDEEEENLTKEELMYGHLKAQRPPYNILPPKEKIEAILKTGEGYVSQIDEPQVREEPPDKEPVIPQRIELPMGEVL